MAMLEQVMLKGTQWLPKAVTDLVKTSERAKHALRLSSRI